MLISKELKEMAKVYRMPFGRVVRYIYIPEIVSKIKGMFVKK